MKRAFLSVLVVFTFAAVSCSSSEKSTTCCEEACRIWEPCWPYETCLSACRDEGDWCDSYLECIRGKSCRELAVCE